MAKVAIKVRLKQDIIDWIGSESKQRGLGWHSCLDQVLDEAKNGKRTAKSEIKNAVKDLIREELIALKKKGKKL